MKVFRLAREKHATPLSGKGAAKYGARWNPVGIELIYTAQNRSLAMAEVAVHLTLATLPEDYRMITIDIPTDIKVKQITEADLPPDWKEFPHPVSTQAIARGWYPEIHRSKDADNVHPSALGYRAPRLLVTSFLQHRPLNQKTPAHAMPLFELGSVLTNPDQRCSKTSSLQ